MDNCNDTHTHTVLRSAGPRAAAAAPVFQELATPTSIRPSPGRSPNGMSHRSNVDRSVTSPPSALAVVPVLVQPRAASAYGAHLHRVGLTPIFGLSNTRDPCRCVETASART
jgi:hypothetical protein